MRRRQFIALAGAATAFPRVALGQQAAKVPRIALLSIPVIPDWFQVFDAGLADVGYVDGKNIAVERFTAPTNDALPAFAARAVASRPDIIVAFGTPPAVAAKNATSTIPIVFTPVFDPTGIGLVTNLAHPGGNLTGNSNGGPDLVGKSMSIIKEVVPGLRRLAILLVPSDPQAALVTPQLEAAARVLGIEPVFVEIIDGQDFAVQFERVVAAGAQAVLQPPFNYFTQAKVRDLFFDLLVRHKLPAISGIVTPGAATPFVGVVSYAASVPGLLRQSAAFVDAVLKGAKPGDLPVQLPTIFDFAVNLDMARKIGLTIPRSILAQATLVMDYDFRAPKGGN